MTILFLARYASNEQDRLRSFPFPTHLPLSTACWLCHRNPGVNELLEIPVPIPNTVVKQELPMIVHQRESRYRRGLLAGRPPGRPAFISRTNWFIAPLRIRPCGCWRGTGGASVWKVTCNSLMASARRKCRACASGDTACCGDRPETVPQDSEELAGCEPPPGERALPCRYGA